MTNASVTEQDSTARRLLAEQYLAQRLTRLGAPPDRGYVLHGMPLALCYQDRKLAILVAPSDGQREALRRHGWGVITVPGHSCGARSLGLAAQAIVYRLAELPVRAELAWVQHARELRGMETLGCGPFRGTPVDGVP